MQTKILSWNIWVDNHFDQIENFLQKSDTDIIGLQEVRDDDPSRDVVKFLEKIGFNYVFTPITKNWNGKIWSFGPAIFTKHQIISKSKFILTEKEDSRALVQADIKISDRVVHVFCTHLTHTHQKDSDLQLQQVKELLAHIPNKNAILMGDFNALPDSETITKVKDVLKDVDINNKPTWSVYPEGCPTCNPQKIDSRLDYIFTTKDIKTNTYKVENSKGSDHLPISVIAEL